MNPGMAGFERLYKDVQLAIVHDCGYDNPSFSHFASMAYWHTATPNSGAEYGWVWRLADTLQPEPVPNDLVNIDTTQSLAVRSRVHTPVMFDDPERFKRNAFFEELPLLARPPAWRRPRGPRQPVATLPDGRGSQRARCLAARARGLGALQVARRLRHRAFAPEQGGSTDRRRSAGAAVLRRLPQRRLRHPCQQSELHQRLLAYVSDSVHGFMRDMERIGRAADVLMMIFSEFGRRVPVR